MTIASVPRPDDMPMPPEPCPATPAGYGPPDPEFSSRVRSAALARARYDRATAAAAPRRLTVVPEPRRAGRVVPLAAPAAHPGDSPTPRTAQANTGP